MSKRKPEPVVEEWAEERGAVVRQLARMAADTPGPSNPDVMFAGGGDGSEPAAYVKLFKLTEDGKHHAAVKFVLVADLKKMSQRAEPEVVGWKPASVLEYLQWLAEKPGKWLKDEICRATGVVPRCSLHRALRSYLAAIYQRDLASTQDERWKMLNEAVEKHRFLADLPGLTESEFFVYSVSGELNEGARKMLLTTHTEDEGDMENVNEAKAEATAPKPVIVKKKAPAAPAAEAPKPAPKPAAKPKAEKKPKAAKAPRAAKPKAEAKPKAAPKLDKYGKAKVDAQRELPVGKGVTYKGKAGKVVRHEARGGVFVEVGGKELLCSPFVLLKKKNGDAKGGK